MSLNGVRIVNNGSCNIIFIDSFSSELEDEMRNQLASIFNGFAETIELPDTYTYRNTVARFVDRYASKADDTQKGMIAELLAHVLINKFYIDFTSLSILKNKEERSIKKGFDIIYYNNSHANLWYSEVKSGNSQTESSTAYNYVLLDRSKSGIRDMFASQRDSLWESALIDVKLSIEEGPRRINLRNLLAEELNANVVSTGQNVILISVLYHDLSDEIESQSVVDYAANLSAEQLFGQAIILSIQKATYARVANFLVSEAR